MNRGSNRKSPISTSGSGPARGESPSTGIFRRRILSWGLKNSRHFPWRETTDPYRVLVGEILLQRTRGEHVTVVYEDFIARWPTATSLSRARLSTISKVIRPLGLAHRAVTLSKLGSALAGREIPINPTELLDLPGVGPYAAHAVPVFAGGLDLPLVDWVIARVLRRYFGLPSGSRPSADRDLWELASCLAKAGKARELWLSVLDFAASTCKPRPLCPQCPLLDSCVTGQSRVRVAADN